MRAAASQDSYGAGPALRAADYTPPAGFVETMERPSPYAQKKSVSFQPGGSTTYSGSSGSSGRNKAETGDILGDLWRM